MLKSVQDRAAYWVCGSRFDSIHSHHHLDLVFLSPIHVRLITLSLLFFYDMTSISLMFIFSSTEITPVRIQEHL